jgi:PleD family two-component response regulator
MSFGVDVFDAQRGWALEAGIDRADKALYQSKHGGRNRVTVYEA